MYSLLATPKMQEWLARDLCKFEVRPDNQHLKKRFRGSTTSGGTFEVLLYKTGTLVIKGSLKDRIYSALMDQINEFEYYGCDEVGVGDFFGPVVYVGVKLTKSAIEVLKKHHFPIKDSKMLKDHEIISIYNTLKDHVDFNKQIVFDSQLKEGLNNVAQKVYYHHLNTGEKPAIIDLFTTENAFFKHSKALNITWNDNLILKTKADSIYFSVALASIFARAIFLEEMRKLEDTYKMRFPLGAGNVLPTARNFVTMYGKDELAKFAKITFKTFNEI